MTEDKRYRRAAWMFLCAGLFGLGGILGRSIGELPDWSAAAVLGAQALCIAVPIAVGTWILVRK